LTLLIASRIADGLDGAVACATRRTDRGAFLDIVLDFFVYATVPLGFAIWSPHTNSLPAALLLASFVANRSAFLAFSIMAERRGMITTRQGQKSIYYLAGIAEGFESDAGIKSRAPAQGPRCGYFHRAGHDHPRCQRQLFDSRTPAGGRCEPVVGHACRESACAAYVADVDADAPKE